MFSDDSIHTVMAVDLCICDFVLIRVGIFFGRVENQRAIFAQLVILLAQRLCFVANRAASYPIRSASFNIVRNRT